MHLVDLSGISIYEQLLIEEALLRADTGEWCILNRGVEKAIVMGISGKPERLLNLSRMTQSPIPLIKRYSGGGTVVVDPSTVFVTFICNSDTRGISPFPHSIMEWSFSFYRTFFEHPLFGLRENDYVIGEKKCGGNAQYIQKRRWVHHTSFLWDFEKENMEYLLLPERRPAYRQDRPHTDFLCCLKDFYPTQDGFFSLLKKHLLNMFPEEISKEMLTPLISRPHRKNTTSLNISSYAATGPCKQAPL